MKKILLLIVLASVGAWYYVNSSKINEAHVNTYYQNMEAATLERKPEAICKLFADDFQSVATVTMAGQRQTDTMDKAKMCQSSRDLYAGWDKLAQQTGRTIQLSSEYTIHSIEIAHDKRSATVDITSVIDVGGIMKVRSRSTDQLIRKNGNVLMKHSDGVGSINMVGMP